MYLNIIFSLCALAIALASCLVRKRFFVSLDKADRKVRLVLLFGSIWVILLFVYIINSSDLRFLLVVIPLINLIQVVLAFAIFHKKFILSIDSNSTFLCWILLPIIGIPLLVLGEKKC